MAIKKIKLYTVALGGTVALSLAVLTAGPAAAQTPGAYNDYSVYAPVQTPGPYNDGYSAYAPVQPYAPSYYDYYGGAYYGGDNTVLARPAFPPGCGAGEPHC